MDQDMRDEAANELEKAIASTKLKLQAKEVDLALIHAPEDNELTRKQIAEVKDIIADMEQRVSLSPVYSTCISALLLQHYQLAAFLAPPHLSTPLSSFTPLAHRSFLHEVKLICNLPS
jgi:ribosomal protein L29